ncbi:MAG: MFS transporter [Pseudonocardia sp.]|nr:MFS transporter [Pseudonocardia sp.]
MTSVQVDQGLLRARTAVVVTFATSGIAFASFASRTPAVREALGLTTAQLGLLLLCMSGGSIAGLPLSGPIVDRFGTARGVLGGAITLGVGLGLAALGLAVGAVAPAAAGLVLVGLGIGVWDVSMNVEGADVERRLGRSLMPRLHAAFSLGTVLGAGVGTVTAAAAIPIAAQVGSIAVLAPLLMVWSTRRFLPRVAPVAEEPTSGSGALRAWREPRTLLVGLLVLAFAFTEGSANDWIAVALVDGHQSSETVGAMAFGLFVIAMTIGRLFGGWMLERFGRVPVLRATAVCALVGLLLVLMGGSTPVALLGALFWGVGASLGFPVGMSAAADDPARAAARVSVVSSIGYTAFLAGPPLIGVLAQLDGILRALFVVVGALVLGLLASGATRPLRPS